MTAPLGSNLCPVLGCKRDRHTSPTGIRYSRCLAHALDLLSRALAPDPSVERPAYLPPGPGSRQSGQTSLPVATRGG